MLGTDVYKDAILKMVMNGDRTVLSASRDGGRGYWSDVLFKAEELWIRVRLFRRLITDMSGEEETYQYLCYRRHLSMDNMQGHLEIDSAIKYEQFEVIYYPW
jgi:hypothetical protein